MLGITHRNRIINMIIRQRTRTADVIHRIALLKRNWTRHVARTSHNSSPALIGEDHTYDRNDSSGKGNRYLYTVDKYETCTTFISTK